MMGPQPGPCLKHVVEEQEIEVRDEEVTGAADMTWDPKNTSPKVIDANPNTTQVPVAASTPVDEDMPDLEDQSFEEPMGKNPK